MTEPLRQGGEGRVVAVTSSLHRDHGYKPPTKAGSWEELGPAPALGTVAGALQIGGLDAELEDLVSIPDVWARVELFKNALLVASKGPAHDAAVREWRGLMTVLALGRYHKLALESSVADLAVLAKKPFTENYDDSMANFPSVIRQLTPADSLSEETGWSSVGLLRYKEKPLAMIVPTTLVAPGWGYGAALDQAISWGYGGRLTDPCSVASMTVPELSAIHWFLTHHWQLDDAAEKETFADGPEEATSLPNAQGVSARRTRLNDSFRRELKSFKLALEGALEARGASKRPRKDVFTEQNLGLTLPKTELYRPLNFVPILDPKFYAEQLPSETILRPREALASRFEGAVVVDSRLAEDWQQPSGSIRVWRQHSLEQLQRRSDLRGQLASDLAKDSYEMVDTSTFFTDHLCQVDNAKAIGQGDAFSDYLLPLKPEILLYLSPEELRQRLSLDRTGGRIRVSLRVGLERQGGGTRDFTFERSYSEADEVVSDRGAPAAAIWPKFARKDWGHYFVFVSGHAENHVMPQSVVSIGLILARLDASPDKAPGGCLHGGLSDEVGGNELSFEDAGEHHLYRLDHPAEALVCETWRDQRRRAAGMLLLPDLPERQESTTAKRWKVGIDFGTTNTCLYFAPAEDADAPPPEPRAREQPGPALQDGGRAGRPRSPPTVASLPAERRDRNAVSQSPAGAPAPRRAAGLGPPTLPEPDLLRR